MINLKKLGQKKSISELLEFGIININKPSGPTSFNISDFIRKTLKEFGIRKTSHFGTLDPKVTGILPAFIKFLILKFPVVAAWREKYTKCLIL